MCLVDQQNVPFRTTVWIPALREMTQIPTPHSRHSSQAQREPEPARVGGNKGAWLVTYWSLPFHSYLNATSGSTWAARRAGM